MRIFIFITKHYFNKNIFVFTNTNHSEVIKDIKLQNQNPEFFF